MHKAIISDTSCLILLEKIGELELLYKLYGTIITTSAVKIEFGLPLPDWFEIKAPTNKNYQAIIETSVDKGEASAIALAVEYDDCLLIIDDLKGRKYAQQLGLQIIGTIGVIVNAKLYGIIPSIKPLIEKIKVHPFHIADIDDNDNNIDLCIKEKSIPIFVEVKENIAIDPRGDKNLNTKMKVIGRWK